MKHAPSKLFTAVRWIAFATVLTFGTAYADEYTDVTQLVRNGKFVEALTKADQYLNSKPRDPQMRFLKGVIQRDSGKTSDAISTFLRLTEDYPELPEPYNNLAVLYAGQGQYDKARTALEMAIRTNPSYTTAHENLGDVYAKLASQAYGKALQLDASNPAVAPKLGLIRELFNPTSGKGLRPNAPPTASQSPPATTTPAKPAPTLAETALAKAPPSLPNTNAVTNNKPASSAPTAPVATNTLASPANNTQASQTTIASSGMASSASASTTPAAAVTAASEKNPSPSENPNHASKDVETTVRNWAKAWAARDVKDYLAAYGKDFATPDGMKRSAWEEERRQRISSKSKISVKLENLTVSVEGNKAIVKFRQDYKANELAVSSRKILELGRIGDRWLIVRESVVN